MGGIAELLGLLEPTSAFPHLSSLHKHFSFKAPHTGTGREAGRHSGQIDLLNLGAQHGFILVELCFHYQGHIWVGELLQQGFQFYF